jgi:hypothetical protein
VTPTTHPTKTPRRATGLVGLLAALLCIAGSGALAVLPASAAAFATLEGPPEFSAAPGLPDGRIYEQVSPAAKNGNQAGGSTSLVDSGALNHYGIASGDGNAVLFEGTGPMGESPSGTSKWFVATKKTGEPGWSTRSLLPAETSGGVGKTANALDPSSDLMRAMVAPVHRLVGSEGNGCLLYLIGSDPFEAATWLGRAEIGDPVEHCGEYESAPVGGTPDFSTVYFTYAGTLLAEDESRTSHAGEAWGFYENREGSLREAGILPADSPYPGKPDPFGAVPAASGHGRNPHGNEVSADGSRAFFVSPDPASCAGTGAAGAKNNCAVDPPELYVRENGERTLLVSRDTLLSEAGGLPASASSGVLQMPNPALQPVGRGAVNGSYAFASPDGSQAFFQSASALTQPAEEASPGAEPKTYDFDVSTGTLTYLPGVVLGESGEILATDGDGSSFTFVSPKAGAEPARLELWTAGPDGGSVTPVMQLPEPGASVPEARMSSDGSVLVFQTGSRLSGAFNSGGAEQIYRYDVPANTLGCVSCAPAGVTPGGASMSILHFAESSESTNHGIVENPVGTADERGISADGDRVFFETPAPLVPQDSNTNSPPVSCNEGELCPQGQDVYEWENGVVYLISTGRSPLSSFLLDSSANGNDVFFATAEGLVPGDTDGGYDIYDARVPHEGEPFPPAAVPCEGAVCQGPPRVESPLAPPARATFPGTDNFGGGESNQTPPPAKKTTTKTVRCKRGYLKHKNKCFRKAKQKQAKKSAKGSK